MMFCFLFILLVPWEGFICHFFFFWVIHTRYSDMIIADDIEHEMQTVVECGITDQMRVVDLVLQDVSMLVTLSSFNLE